MKINEEKIGDYVFTKNANGNKFKVPDYQRPYVWDSVRVEEYFVDLISSESNMPFLGSLIFLKNNNKFDIVDGQQRLITTSILIGVLRDISEKLKDNPEYSEEKGSLGSLENTMLDKLTDRSNSGDVKGVVLEIWEENQEFFKKFILSGDERIEGSKKPLKKNIAKYNIYNNYNVLKELVEKKIKDSNKEPSFVIEDIIDTIDELSVVCIEVDSDEEAYTAFEIVNARGQELGNIDLLKNLFYKKASSENDLEWMKGMWKKIVGNIEDVSAVKVNTESFLKFFWHSYYGESKITTSKNLYRNFSRYINEQGYKKVANQLIENSKIFKSFFELVDYKWTDNDTYNRQILRSLKNIRSFDITQSYVLFMSMVRNKVEGKKIRDIIEAVEKFHFAYSAVSKKQANRVEKLYGKYAERINCAENDSNKLGTIFNQFVGKMEEIFPKENEFKENFELLSYKTAKHKRVIRYVFNKIHLDSSHDSTSLNFDENQANLEHIVSQSNNGDIDDRVLHSIGNLIPLSKKLNSSAGNKDLKEKVEEYRKDLTITLVNEIVEKITDNKYIWDEKDIKNWTEELSERIYKISKKLR